MAQVEVPQGDVVRYDQLLNGDIRNQMLEMELMKKELLSVRTQIKTTEKKIEEGEQEKKALNNKLSSLKVKLGVSNANLNVSKEEMESLRTSLNETQIHVARMEERLSAANTELDRLRDPANPDSNMGIKKHVANDRRDIKKTKLEIGVEHNALVAEQESIKKKEYEIKEMERFLSRLRDELHVCEAKREEAQENEELEKQKKEDMVKEYNLIRKERKQYDNKIKQVKIKLGVSQAGQNVNAKLMADMSLREQQLMRRLNMVEKKFKETFAELEVLKSKDKMTKTALSINDHTTRFTKKRERHLSLAQSGVGQVKYSEKVPKALQGDPKYFKGGEKADSRRPKQQDGLRQKTAGSQIKPQGNAGQKKREADDIKKAMKQKSGNDKTVQFIPPPKPKLKQTK